MKKVSLDISREEELSENVSSFQVLYSKSHNGFKEEVTMKNSRDGVATVLEFNLKIFFFLTPLFHFLKLSYLFSLTH